MDGVRTMASNTVNGPCNHKDLYLWHRGSVYIYSADVLAGGIVLAYVAYEGEGTQESVGVESQREKEVVYNAPSTRNGGL